MTLHLPGIGGHLRIDDMLLRGLQQGGIQNTEIYDWTAGDPGLNALLARDRNRQQAKLIATLLAERLNANPSLQIDVTAHSGGTGILIWALEQAGPEVKVRNVLLLASALSPQYDLSRALSHVTGKVYVFYSEHDEAVLGYGTRAFGTIDGVRTEAAGLKGFVMPEGADPFEYRKLIAMPYNPDWMRYGNDGDHLGTMMTPFARRVLAPLLTPPQIVDVQ